MGSYLSFEVLSAYAVLLAITLANASQIHLTLNRLEERRNRLYPEFDKARREIKGSCLALVATFVIAILLLFTKGIVVDKRGIAAINGLNLWILFAQIAITWDVFAAVMLIGADVRRVRSGNGERDQSEPEGGG